MLQAFILAAIILVLIDVIYVRLVLWPIYRNWRNGAALPSAPLAILQFTIVGLLAKAILFSSYGGILCPPIDFLMTANRLWPFMDFLLVPLLFGIFFAAVAFWIWRRNVTHFRQLAWCMFAIAFFTTAYIAAALSANFFQTRTIAALAPDCFRRGSFWHSVQIAGEEFQFDTHVIARKYGVVYGWSFKELDFYPIPESVTINLDNVC